MDIIKPGSLLISDPFLQDPNFMRTVVLICEHRNDGDLGFVLNRQYQASVGMVLQEISSCMFPVFYGGPVQQNTLHYIHASPQLISNGVQINDEIFWGGDLEDVIENIKNGKLSENDIRFFIGYSGWSENQLETELETKSWITRPATQPLVFHKNAMMIWQDALKEMGGEYEQMINYPIDPQLN